MQEVKLEDVSAIRHRFFLTRLSDLYRRVVVARFEGAHRAGAEGAGDTRFIEGVIGLSMALWTPEALVVDLTALAYPGGESIRQILRPVQPDLEEGFPLYVAASAGNREALAAALPGDALCSSVEEAIERIRSAGPWSIR